MFPTWLLGILLAIAASVVSNLGLNLQKRAHMNMSARDRDHHSSHNKESGGQGSVQVHPRRLRTSSTSTVSSNGPPSVSFVDGDASTRSTPEKNSDRINPLSPSGILKKSGGSGKHSEYHLLDSSDEREEARQARRDDHRRSKLPPIPASPNGPAGSSSGGSNPGSLMLDTGDGDGSGEKNNFLSVDHTPSPHFHAPAPKSYTSLNELAQGSIDLDDYGPTPKVGQGRGLNGTPGSHARTLPNGLPSNGSSVAMQQTRNRSFSAASASTPTGLTTGGRKAQRRRSSVTIDGVTVHRKSSTAGHHAPREKQGHYTKQPIWILGLVCVILGSLLDFTALAFVDQAVVAPLGSLTLVSNVFFAPLLLKEKVNRKQLYCTFLIILGSCLAVAFAPHESTSPDIQLMFDNFARARFVVYGIICVSSLAGLRVACWKFNKIRRNDPHGAYPKIARYHTFAYAACAGIMGAQSVLFAKCTAMLLAASIAGDGLMFVFWGTYFVLLGLGVTIFLQIRWLNSGLRMFSALMIVPIFQSFWILISVISGMIFFGEYAGVFDKTANAILFPLGLGLTICGVYFLTQIKPPGSEAGEGASAHRRRSRSSVRASSLSGIAGVPSPLNSGTHAAAQHHASMNRGDQHGEFNVVSSSSGLSPENVTVVISPPSAFSGAASTTIAPPSTPLMHASLSPGEHYGVPQSPRDTPPNARKLARPAPLQHPNAAHAAAASLAQARDSALERSVDLGSYSAEDHAGERFLRRAAGEESELDGPSLRSPEEDEEFGSGSEGEDGSGSDDGSTGSSEDADGERYPDYAVHSLAPLNFPLFLLPRKLMEEPSTPRPYFEENSSGFNESPEQGNEGNGGGSNGLGGLPYTHLFRIAPVREEQDEENPAVSTPGPLLNSPDNKKRGGSDRGVNGPGFHSAVFSPGGANHEVPQEEWTTSANVPTSSVSNGHHQKDDSLHPDAFSATSSRRSAVSSAASSTAFSPHVLSSPAFSPTYSSTPASHSTVDPSSLDLSGMGSSSFDTDGQSEGLLPSSSNLSEYNGGDDHHNGNGASPTKKVNKSKSKRSKKTPSKSADGVDAHLQESLL